jgi:hypothetical protein
MVQLGIPANPEGSGLSNGDWKDSKSDYQFLYDQCKDLQHQVEMLNTSITGLASIAASRQSFKEQQIWLAAAERSVKEARRARALVLVGLVFIPLAYTASLFSMTDPYGPGSPQFWLYFAISFPLVALVLSAYYILDFGYSRDGSQWSLQICASHVKELFRVESRVQ